LRLLVGAFRLSISEGKDTMRTDITKQEVVSRQLETAIALFFCDDDAISIHVLASAASQILYDVCKHKGKVSIRDVWQDYIVEEHQKDWRALTTRAYNYFKHAKDDPFTELERFDPRSNEWLLFNACVDYLTTYSGTETPFEILAYFTWFLAVRPQIIRKGHPLTAVILSDPSFNELREKSPDQQRRWAADMLRASYAHHLNKRPPVTGLSEDFCDNGLVVGGGTITEYY
jgi:hypothetical protein